jgi:quinolinate synthase
MLERFNSWSDGGAARSVRIDDLITRSHALPRDRQSSLVLPQLPAREMITLPKLRDTLRDRKYEVAVDLETATRARGAIERMVSIT